MSISIFFWWGFAYVFFGFGSYFLKNGITKCLTLQSTEKALDEASGWVTAGLVLMGLAVSIFTAVTMLFLQ